MQLIKYTRPSSYDFAPYSTQWVLLADQEKEIFIQINEDENHPRWEKMGRVLEIAFADFLSREEFTSECLRLFKYKQEDPLMKITEIIKEQQR